MILNCYTIHNFVIKILTSKLNKSFEKMGYKQTAQKLLKY